MRSFCCRAKRIVAGDARITANACVVLAAVLQLVHGMRRGFKAIIAAQRVDGLLDNLMAGNLIG